MRAKKLDWREKNAFKIHFKHLLYNFCEWRRVSKQPTHKRVLFHFLRLRPDVESGLATKEGGAVTHFRCLQGGIFFNAVLHDAPSFVLLINCDSCSPGGGVLHNTKIIVYQRAFGIYV